MKIETYRIPTSMGQIIGKNPFPFLTDIELKELDLIGYSGKNSKGEKIGRVDFLNSLHKGIFSIEQIRWDKGDFREEFVIVRAFSEAFTEEQIREKWNKFRQKDNTLPFFEEWFNY
jgi:hypothetical protein